MALHGERAARVSADVDFPVEEVRADFPGVNCSTYLNSAAESLFLGSHRDALVRYAGCKEAGSLGRAECAAIEARCRQLVAQLLSVAPGDVAFVASTARALDAAVKSVEFRPGDNIVIGDSEFPTSAFAGAHLARTGVECRVAPSRDGELALDDLERLIDERTRLVVVSLVSYRTGFLVDQSELERLAHARGALLFIDAIQAFGALPVTAGSADFVAAGTYKWQLGAHGLAFFYVNPGILHELRPPYVGYRGVVDLFPPDRFERYELLPDARRFEEGMPNYPAMFVLENGLSYLMRTGITAAAEHRARLVARVMAGLDELGVCPLTTRNPHARGPIVSFETARPAALVEALARQGVHVWGRDGRLRVSPSLYNTLDEVELFLEVLAELPMKLQ